MISLFGQSSYNYRVKNFFDTCRLSQEEFKHQRILMRDKIREMLKKPGFPGDISYGEVSCFDEGLVSALRKKVKMLIDGYVLLVSTYIHSYVAVLVCHKLGQNLVLQMCIYFVACLKDKVEWILMHQESCIKLLPHSGLSSEVRRSWVVWFLLTIW